MKKIFIKLLLVLVLGLLVLPGGLALAENKIKPEISVTIGGFNSEDFKSGFKENSEYCPKGADEKSDVSCIEISWISQYISAIYRYGVGLAAVLAVIVMMAGGLMWLSSGGSPDRLGKGKELIIGALSGLIIALFSYLILYSINPALVESRPLVIRQVAAVKTYCCLKGDGTYGRESFTGSKCSAGGSPVSDDLCKTKAELCQEDGGQYVVGGRYVTSGGMNALNKTCKDLCAQIDSEMKSIKVDEDFKSDSGSLAGCCYCKAKNVVGCCRYDAAWVFEAIGRGDEYFCANRTECLTTNNEGMDFKEITGECTVEACKKLTWE